ncbi:MAG TPA: hypothetical protein VGM30_14660 [Puia sp.]|jgi:hypothetical protein
MQRINLLLLPLLLLIALSCKKSSNNTIIGNWSIIDDSTKFVSTVDGYPSTHSDYIGQPGDYYNFSPNGNLYVKEGTLTSTMAYEVLRTGQVRCTPLPGYTENYNATDITATTATFHIINTGPTGQVTKVIHLRK